MFEYARLGEPFRDVAWDRYGSEWAEYIPKSDEGRYSADGILPVCVRNAMEWEAKVLVRTDEGLVAAPFRFITVKPGAELPNR